MTSSSTSFNSLKFFIATAAIGSFVLLISSCGHQAGGTIEVYETVGYQPNHGPFDSNGNYVEKWADNPPKRKYISRDKKKSAPIKATPPPQYATAPKPAYTPPKKASSPSQPKSRAVVVKPKKRSPLTHTVKKGDTLYGLSRKYATSVNSIQRANGIRGSNIGIGQKLIIPR
ncbi:MAG: LysM peptidoglycan-binding domain-containing protein [Rubritalea sp.]|uniref:LysM peptidoglycan-binding domain-containing protein n=1 Tax=Rubritalea sp. TaxID=2109375 RepID=UPI0032427BD4